MAGCTVLFGKQLDHYPYNDDFTRKCAKSFQGRIFSF